MPRNNYTTYQSVHIEGSKNLLTKQNFTPVLILQINLQSVLIHYVCLPCPLRCLTNYSSPLVTLLWGFFLVIVLASFDLIICLITEICGLGLILFGFHLFLSQTLSGCFPVSHVSAAIPEMPQRHVHSVTRLTWSAIVIEKKKLVKKIVLIVKVRNVCKIFLCSFSWTYCTPSASILTYAI